MRLGFAFIFISGVLICGCATTNLQSFGKASANISLEDDEARFWKRSEEEREKIDSSGHIYEDLALEEYINQVLTRITPSEIKSSPLKLKARVVKDPFLNAFTFPDGTIYIHTGILARMDNEAQLAALLGHEMTHAINRHTVKFFRDLKNKTAFYTTFSVTAGGVGGAYGDLASILGAVGVQAAIYGYSKDNEREADEIGFKAIAEAGYDVTETPKLFKHLQDNFDKEKKNEPFFFGTHPRLKERIDSYEELIKDTVIKESYSLVERRVNREEFLKYTHSLVLDNSLLDISKGRFETAKAGIRKYLDYEPESAKGYYYLAEAYLHQFEQPENKKLKDKETKGEKKVKAKEFLLRAIKLDQSFALAYKSLGLMYMKDNSKDEAWQNLERYLELSPDAADRLYVENYLKRLLE